MKSCLSLFPIQQFRIAVPAVLFAVLTGCVATQEVVPGKQKVLAEPDTTEIHRRFITLRQVRTGMSRQEVRGIIGGKVIVGYALEDPRNQYYKPLTVNNPYRRQDLEVGSKTYEVDFYLLGIKTADGEVTNDELVPLVFHNHQLIGSGWPFLDSLNK